MIQIDMCKKDNLKTEISEDRSTGKLLYHVTVDRVFENLTEAMMYFHEESKNMKLYEYMKRHPDIYEFTVYDKDYDVEVYFYPNEMAEYDEWEDAEVKIAKVLDVIEANGRYVTTNLSEVIKRNLDNGVFKDLFIRNDVDSIMDDIENILSGQVGVKWMMQFAESLK